MRIFEPLKANHPLVVGLAEFSSKHKCYICRRSFLEGQRVTLIPIETPDMSGSLTVEAKAAHATCRYKGVKTPQGIVERIKDGDASPYPVIMTNGKQFKIEEVELPEF